MKDVAGKVAFITGGDSGIGFGLAKVFADAGMKVVITYMSEDHLRDALAYFDGAGQEVHAIRLDVADRSAMKAAANETERIYGKVHLLCNNAGVGIKGRFRDSTFEDWDWGLGVNLGGVINGILTFLPGILAHGEESHIVTTASMSGIFATPNASIYNTAKFAVVGLMETLRSELAEDKIGVSVFCPGLVATNIYVTSRLRPAEYQRDDTKRPTAEELQKSKAIMSKGMDPVECAEKVLRGIRNNDLFILTHPEFEQGIRDRFDAILGSIPYDEPDLERVRVEAMYTLRNEAYIDECARRRTSHMDHSGADSRAWTARLAGRTP